MSKNDLWTEKYRPKTIEELDCSSFLKKFLQNATVNGFPHLLLYGPPGTGKTTFASLLNPTFELNASDDRGIEIIRNKIKKVANTVSKQVIVLDECENLTKDSQTCLRRILEDFPNTRFIFCTNYYSRIIDPLKSRLLKLKFNLKESKALERIGSSEQMKYDKKFYQELLRKCNFDLRKCLNILQGIKPLKKFDLDEVIGILKNEIIDQFKTVDFSNYRNFIKMFLFQGYNFMQLLMQLTNNISGTDLQRAEMARILAECEGKSINGCSDEICLEYLCLNYISIINA